MMTSSIQKFALGAKIGIFCIIILGVWVLFAVPVIFYHLQQEVSDTIDFTTYFKFLFSL